jgi:hypothetical protein
LDSDDRLTPDSISARVAVLRLDPNVDFTYGRTSVQDEEGNELFEMTEPWPKPGQARIARYLFDTNSPMMRRELASNVGLWRLDDTHGQEFEYFARLKYFAKSAHYIDRPLSIYVRHPSTNTVCQVIRLIWRYDFSTC